MTVKSYIKLKSVKIHVLFCKIKGKIKFMRKIDKISIILGIIIHSVLWMLFLQTQIEPYVSLFEEHFSKTYITLPIAILLTLLISHFYHKKDKPNQEFWDTNRKETIDDIITYIRQAKSNLFELETFTNEPQKFQKSLEFLFNNNISSIGNIASIHGQYLSNREHRRLRTLVQSISRYVSLLAKPQIENHSELLVDSIELIEGTIAYLIIDFKLSSIDQINILLKPISKSTQNDSMNSRRHLNRMIIQNSLNIKLPDSD